MDSATMELYLQKVEEFVHDEDKIVTFRWLSTNLGISATDAKKLLQQYVTDQRDLKPSALALTYSLMGLLEDNSMAITVVKEDELEDKKGLFSTVFNQDIYSVQKSKDVDLNVMSLVDYFDMHTPQESPVIGSTVSKQCVKRVFKAKKALPPPREPVIKGKVSMFTRFAPKITEKADTKTPSKSTETTTASPKQPSVKETPPKPKQNGLGIASFFNRNASPSSAKVKEPQKAKEPEKPKTEEEKPVNASKPEDEKKNNQKTAANRLISLVDSDSETEESSSQSQSVSSKPSKENQKPKRNAKRQRKDNKKSAPSPKRRKRIIEQDDSDDDIFGNQDEPSREESVLDISDEDCEPVMLAKPPLAPKNKKRKLVDRTFTDEDGYIITRKEWVEEDPSGDEEEQQKSQTEEVKAEKEQHKPDLKRKEVEDVKVPDNKKLKKTPSDLPVEKVANGKGKAGKGKKAVATNQPTLMNFFKRS